MGHNLYKIIFLWYHCSMCYVIYIYCFWILNHITFKVHNFDFVLYYDFLVDENSLFWFETQLSLKVFWDLF